MPSDLLALAHDPHHDAKRPWQSEPGLAGSHETALKKFLSVSELAPRSEMAVTHILGVFRIDAETDSAAASPALTLGRSPRRKTSRTASRRLRIRRAGGRASMPTRRCRAKRHHLCSVGRNYCLRVRFRGSDAMRFRSIWAVGTRVIAGNYHRCCETRLA